MPLSHKQVDTKTITWTPPRGMVSGQCFGMHSAHAYNTSIKFSMKIYQWSFYGVDYSQHHQVAVVTDMRSIECISNQQAGSPSVLCYHTAGWVTGSPSVLCYHTAGWVTGSPSVLCYHTAGWVTGRAFGLQNRAPAIHEGSHLVPHPAKFPNNKSVKQKLKILCLKNIPLLFLLNKSEKSADFNNFCKLKLGVSVCHSLISSSTMHCWNSPSLN